MSSSARRGANGPARRRMLPQVPAGSRGEAGRAGERAAGAEAEENVFLLPSQSTIREASTRLSLSPFGLSLKREFSSSSALEEIDGEDSSVTVAIRVRPFSRREQRLGAKQVVRMHGNETIITSGEGVAHRFYYDHCFWSFDSTQSEYADQKHVYLSLAQPLLECSFEGFNTCLFAYGQTGSGKSYCIMGEGETQGIVPQFCQELFDRVNSKQASQVTFKVQVSYYEIYNEKIYDLLASTTTKSKTRLRVREHPVLGPYVEDLSTYVAGSYKDIEHWITLGNRFRATATTGMNDRSSRSHSVFTIMLTQTSVLEGNEHSKVSRINLIDLAGSERSSVAQTSGERLKEGASINRSLHTLGKVVSLLSERSTGKRKKVFIPYRDSTLTWLLKESLGGNSKTAMIATISPADLHHSESLSTLRYAHQARSIINVAKINEDPNARIIRDLRSEIHQLRALVGAHMDPSSSLMEIRELREKLRESEKLLTESTRTWQERLNETEKRKKEEMETLRVKETLMIDNRMPNLVNLNEDPQLSEMLLYVLKEGVSTVGRISSHDIQLVGALVAEDHCSIVHQNGSVVIRPSGSDDAHTFVNGKQIEDATTLHHGDRVVFGGEHFFRLNHPLEVERGGGGERGSLQGQHGFEFARNELVRAQTEKIEAELEQRRLAEREELMRELQMMKERAQEEMDEQREGYESRLSELETQMEGKSTELSVYLQSREETESRIGALQQKNQELERETLAQKHLIQLEKLKTEKEYADMKEKRTQLMTELEKEKQKLEEDIESLHKNKLMREKGMHKESFSCSYSVSGEVSLLKGTELVRLAMMLQEATNISKNLNKPLTFSREETVNTESRELEVSVRVQDTALGQVTYWDLEKFEGRLDQMREIYQSHSLLTSSSTSLEGGESVLSLASSDDPPDPFHDPSDTWIRDSLSTPQTSPRHPLLRSFSTLSSTPSPTTLSSSRRALDLTSSIPRNYHEMRSWSKGLSSGSLVSKPHPLTISLSLPRLCHDRTTTILAMKEDPCTPQGSVFHRAIECVLKMSSAAADLSRAFTTHTTTPDTNVPFSETTDARTDTLLLYVFLERLIELSRCLRTQCLMMEDLAKCHARDGETRGEATTNTIREQSPIHNTCTQLINDLSHQTALYCSKLFTTIDKDIQPLSEDPNAIDTIRDITHDLQESLEHVTALLGRLALSWRVQEKWLTERLQLARVAAGSSSEGAWSPEQPSGTTWLLGDGLDSYFNKEEPYTQLAPSFYRGFCEWTTLRIESSCYTIQKCTSTLQPLLKASCKGFEVLTVVGRLLSTVVGFLQSLAAMQSEVWGIEYFNSSAGSDESVHVQEIIPSIHHIIEMLLNTQQVECTIVTLTSGAISSTSSSLSSSSSPWSNLSSHTRQLGATSNKMAAAVVAVLRNSTSTQAPELAAEVQRLSQTTGLAIKCLSSLLKRNLASSSVPHVAPASQIMSAETGSTSSVVSEGTLASNSRSFAPHAPHVPPVPPILSSPEVEATSVEYKTTTNCSHSDSRSHAGSPHAKEINVRPSETPLTQGSGHYLETENDYV